MPAYPYIVFVDVDGRKIPVYLFGDEFSKRLETKNGYTIRQNSEGIWCYAQKESDGSLQPTEWSIADDSLKSPELMDFLRKTPKHLKGTGFFHKNMFGAEKVSRKINHIPVVGSRRILVILMSFQDVKFTKTSRDFDALFNQRGFCEDGAKGSVVDFYEKVSYGQLQLSCDIYGPYVAKNNMKHYGGNGKFGEDKAPDELFKEAISSASKEVDMSIYDTNKDGIVDNIHIIFAGYGEEAGASEDAIWSHEMTFPNNYELNGVKIDRYSCAPELRGNSGGGISRIGPHCHEIGHALGAMDYYDTNYSTEGEYIGTGQWDVMASGSWNEDGISPANFNPFVKAYNFGWCKVETLSESADIVVKSSFSENIVYRVNTPHSNEYFLIENRQQESYDSNTPGHGLLLFHIDSKIEALSQNNTINASFPQACYIVCASSDYRLPNKSSVSYGNINSTGCPFPGTSLKTSFNYKSTPAALCNNGNDAEFSLLSINENDDKTISFSINFEKAEDGEDYSQTSGEIVWQDTFSSIKLDSFWNQESIEGKSSWSIKHSGAIGNYQSYLQLSPFFPITDKKSIRVVTRLRSSLINVDNDNYILSFKMASKNSGIPETDTICISFFQNGHELKNLSHKYPATSGEWIEQTIAIDQSALPIEFAIDGICYKNTDLMIDDITIRKSSHETSIESIIPTSYTEGLFYTLTGVMVSSEVMHSHPGIYIHKGKKIIIR